MKWNNRLKTVLTAPAKSGFSADCLETILTKADKTKPNGVSSAFVSDEFRHLPKNQTISDEIEKQQNLVSSAFVSSHSRDSFKNNDELREIKTGNLLKILNRFIEKGIAPDVSVDEFQVIDANQILKTSDREFLEINNTAILCTLQQSLLVKHLFSHSLESLKDFDFEIMERESIMTKFSEPYCNFYCSAVISVTRLWFERLVT